jgi:hypothetical protein
MEAAFSPKWSYSRVQTLEIDEKSLKSVSPTFEIIQLGHFQGTQTLLREEIDRGWGGQSAPQMTSFPGSKKLRLVNFGKK